jgi:hypothetical protein
MNESIRDIFPKDISKPDELEMKWTYMAIIEVSTQPRLRNLLILFQSYGNEKGKEALNKRSNKER